LITLLAALQYSLFVVLLGGTADTSKQVQEGAAADPECGCSTRDDAADRAVRKSNSPDTSPA